MHIYVSIKKVKKFKLTNVDFQTSPSFCLRLSQKNHSNPPTPYLPRYDVKFRECQYTKYYKLISLYIIL